MEFFVKVVEILQRYWPLFAQGMMNTMLIALTGTMIGLIIGFLFSFLKTQKNNKRDRKITKILKSFGRGTAHIYIEVIRGTPMMVQAVFFYYGLTSLGYKLPVILAGIVVVSINTGAYMAEIIRAGIQSVDQGQSEAASSLGMNNLQIMRYVVLPQAIKNVLPSIGNEFVVNIKDTSVLNVIGVTELYFQSSSIAGTTYRYFDTFFVTAVLYFILTFTTTRILNYIERKMDEPLSSFPASQTVPQTMNIG